MALSMRCTAAAIALIALATSSARAEDDVQIPDDTGAFVETVGKNALTRARRSLTLGPMVGIAAGAGAIDGELDGQLTFGLSLMRYEIPLLPSGEGLRKRLMTRFRKEVARRIAARGGNVSDEDKRRIAREVWNDVKAELVAEMTPSRFERPGFGVRLEAARLFDSGVWDIRPMFGLGVGPVQVWAGPSLRIDDGAGFVVPLEVSKPMLATDGLRSPVVEGFARVELAVTRRDDFADVIMVGLRLTLDVI